MKKVKSFVFLFLFLMIFWAIFSYPLNTQEILFGTVVSFLISLLFFWKAEIFSEIRLNPKAILYSIIFIFVFLFELLKSNLDVAFRVIDPRLPINPGIVKVKTKLKSKLGRVFLANSITLTPGTLTVDTHEEFFYIHWINISHTGIDKASKEIVQKFEKYLEVMFG